MAVYTELSTGEIADFLRRYDLGALVFAKGIAQGVENSNYLLATRDTQGKETKFIFTIYEKRVTEKDLPFFLEFMELLSRSGLPCPVPIRGRDGALYYTVRNKPAAVISFLEGRDCKEVRLPHLVELGTAVARMHMAGKEFSRTRANTLLLSGWQAMYVSIGDRMDSIAPGLSRMVEDELEFLSAHWPRGLPGGVIHADIFPDNVFFQNDKLTGIIDYYFACNDFWMYDLTICMNAWCFPPNGEFNAAHARALLSSYEKIRAVTPDEWESMPILARGAALRFLMTRAYDWLHQVEGALVTPKDPMEYVRKLAFHQRIKTYKEYGG